MPLYCKALAASLAICPFVCLSVTLVYTVSKVAKYAIEVFLVGELLHHSSFLKYSRHTLAKSRRDVICTRVNAMSCNVRACFFQERVINIWNKLPTPAVDFKNLSSFKNTISSIKLTKLLGPS